MPRSINDTIDIDNVTMEDGEPVMRTRRVVRRPRLVQMRQNLIDTVAMHNTHIAEITQDVADCNTQIAKYDALISQLPDR